MLLYFISSHINTSFKSLPRRMQHMESSNTEKGAVHTIHLNKEALLCTRPKGSYTVEAAVILPLVAAFLSFFLFFFRVMQVEYRVQEALVYAGRQTAAYSGDSTSGAVSLALAVGYFQKEIADDEYIDEFVQNGNLGIVVTAPNTDEGYLYLRATYKVKFPIGYFSFNGIGLTAETRHRIWSGSTLAKTASEDPVVYYTETGTVYHTTLSCTYLNLSISMCSAEDVDSRRNKSGGKYTACSLCAEGEACDGIVYITDYGTVYHTSVSCSGLKRTIYTVKLSEAGSRRACSKCG